MPCLLLTYLTAHWLGGRSWTAQVGRRSNHSHRRNRSRHGPSRRSLRLHADLGFRPFCFRRPLLCLWRGRLRFSDSRRFSSLVLSAVRLVAFAICRAEDGVWAVRLAMVVLAAFGKRGRTLPSANGNKRLNPETVYLQKKTAGRREKNSRARASLPAPIAEKSHSRFSSQRLHA